MKQFSVFGHLISPDQIFPGDYISARDGSGLVISRICEPTAWGRSTCYYTYTILSDEHGAEIFQIYRVDSSDLEISLVLKHK